MIQFATDSFKIDLTHVAITLNEENSLFYDYFVKNYSRPFSLNLQDATASELRFVTAKNIKNETLTFSGYLTIDNKIHAAEMVINKSVGDLVQGVVRYGSTIGAVLETNLKNLPFPIVIEVGNFRTHASGLNDKTYPETDYNFPSVIDHDFKSKSNYDDFYGTINYFSGYYYANTTKIVDSKVVASNINVVTPYPYIMTILRTGFEAAGLKMVGDFFNDKANEKLLLQTTKFLEAFTDSNKQNLQFSVADSQGIEDGLVVYTYTKTVSTTAVGQWRLKTFLNLPDTVEIKSFEIKNGATTLLKQYNNNSVDDFLIEIKNASEYGDINIVLKVYPHNVNDLSPFTFINWYMATNKVNICPSTFSLAEIMPDMTFGGFLSKLKNWLNLDIVFGTSTVSVNYIENKFLETFFKNHQKFEIDTPSIKYNDLDYYKLIFDAATQLLISKDGIEFYQVLPKNKNIKTIPVGVSVLAHDTHLEQTTATHQETDADIRILIYNGLQDSLPTALPSVFGRSYTYEEVFALFWQKWLNFRLNAVEITDKYNIEILEEINIHEGLYKYNEKQLIKKLTKKRISETFWQITAVTETLR